MVDIDTFTTAAANGDISRVEQMLENGIDPNGVNRYGRTALQVLLLYLAQPMTLFQLLYDMIINLRDK